jgi:hypothetical protein
MFRLLVSNTLVNLSIASWLFGPGIVVLTIGRLGSSGKNSCSPLEVGADAVAAEAIARVVIERGRE